MRLTLLAFLGLVVACLLAVGTASADSGTFSGSITPTACGPMHAITVVAGETTVTAAANMDVAANDITLELYDPSGALKAHGDTATSPESVVYQSDNLATGIWHVQVCPFSGGLVAQPYSYNGTFSTSNAPVVNATPPGSGGGAPGGTPTPTYVAGKLVFSPATVVDPQRTEGEPLNFLDPKSNTYWESGPFGTTTQMSLDPPLDRQRARVPRRQPCRPPARCASRAAATPTSPWTTRATTTSSTSRRSSTSAPRSRTTTATPGARTPSRCRTPPSTGSGTPSTTERPRARRTTPSFSRSTRPPSARSSTRARARPARPTRLAGSSGRTPPQRRRERSRPTPPAGRSASTG